MLYLNSGLNPIRGAALAMTICFVIALAIPGASRAEEIRRALDPLGFEGLETQDQPQATNNTPAERVPAQEPGAGEGQESSPPDPALGDDIPKPTGNIREDLALFEKTYSDLVDASRLPVSEYPEVLRRADGLRSVAAGLERRRKNGGRDPNVSGGSLLNDLDPAQLLKSWESYYRGHWYRAWMVLERARLMEEAIDELMEGSEAVYKRYEALPAQVEGLYGKVPKEEFDRLRSQVKGPGGGLKRYYSREGIRHRMRRENSGALSSGRWGMTIGDFERADHATIQSWHQETVAAIKKVVDRTRRLQARTDKRIANLEETVAGASDAGAGFGRPAGAVNE